MRASAEDPVLASQSGINVHVPALFAWALAGAILAVAGILYSARSAVAFSSQGLALRALVPAFIGGLDSLRGALAGGLIFGVIEAFVVRSVGTGVSDAAAFVVLISLLALRPQGVFGRVGVNRV